MPLFYSKKERGIWQTPIEITQQHYMPVKTAPLPALNNDGTELFLYKTDNYDGAIYSSQFR